MTVRGGVGDILAVCCPLDFVAAILHEPDEVFTVTSQGHALVDVDFQIHLPAIALGIGAVLPVGHGAFLLLLLLGFHNRKTVLHTQLVRCFPELFQRISVAVVLETGVAAYGVDHEMGMNVITIRMSCHYDFEAGDLLRQLQGDLMGLLRGDRIIRPEGLNHVVVHPSLGTVVQTLGVHEFLQGTLRHTVDARDQRPALEIHLGILTAVVDDRIETAHGLGAFAFYEMDDGHYFHRLALRMSESKELTCAYASESSLRYTVFTLPILARVVSWLRFRPMAFC